LLSLGASVFFGVFGRGGSTAGTSGDRPREAEVRRVVGEEAADVVRDVHPLVVVEIPTARATSSSTSSRSVPWEHRDRSQTIWIAHPPFRLTRRKSPW